MANPKLTVEVEDRDVDIHEADVINENDNDDEVEFEVSKDSVKEVEKEETAEASSNEDELEEYSESVKKRISQLTYKMREAERQREEAVKYAENIVNENKKLKTSLKNSDSTLVNEAVNRVQSQLDQAKKQYKLAYENGDADEMASANEQIARLGAEADNLTRVKRRLDSQEQEQEVVDVPQQQQVQQRPSQPDPKAQEWAGRNKWFGEDQVMTFAVMGIHRELADLGYDLQSDDYYKEIDKRMRKEFPHKFTSETSDANVNVQPKVAAPTRGAAKNAARRVRLTPSQVAIAKRLGVPLEEYAKHVKGV
jgi:hypothetical protein